ncbi:FecCD family ABC transporter permease [Paeniglutamicibacter cryotolerans]|uniref:Iron complex transport system permease protein n=1 Tax=Paeniglutamicibacter cryotolerans TaxID=670079 RepID=A0A839QER4_9MICC|nr:iron chelate uptake ABC transporter family permease subunit [Paeniglutamicibacter cryotolerans]MBB2994400.1 iron complex transport system permease protein [Paeniglutamicibacter cryotolerans]
MKLADAPAATATPGGAAAGQTSRQAGWLGLALLCALAVAVLLSLSVGARGTGVGTVWAALTAPDPANGEHAVVLSRVPRTVAGLLVGSALGLAGTAMQGIARNPLADPGILGINAGAALAVVLGIQLFSVSGIGGHVWLAFLGAGLAAALVYAVASLGREGATALKLALAGAALCAGLGSLLNAVLLLSREAFDAFRFWQVGMLGVRSLSEMVQVAPFLLLGSVLALGSARLFNALSLGDDAARGLGIAVGRSRAVAAVAVVLLCGGATALAGPVAFVGLVIPHLLRLAIGGNYSRLLPLSLLAGPLLVLAADVLGRVIAPPSEVQVGVMTAVIGAPVFLWMLRAGKKVEL